VFSFGVSFFLVGACLVGLHIFARSHLILSLVLQQALYHWITTTLTVMAVKARKAWDQKNEASRRLCVAMFPLTFPVLCDVQVARRSASGLQVVLMEESCHLIQRRVALPQVGCRRSVVLRLLQKTCPSGKTSGTLAQVSFFLRLVSGTVRGRS